MPPSGGARPGSGRKRCDPTCRSIHLNCAIIPALWEELRKREVKTGVYRTQIVRAILSDVLIGGVVTR